MRKKLITLAALATLALTATACANSDEKSTETGSDSSVSAEDTKTENTKETEESNSEVNLEEKEQAVSQINIFLGTMGYNTSYYKQAADREKDNELLLVMSEDEDFDRVISIVRSGDLLFIETIDYENMSDTEIYDYIQATYVNAALFAQTSAVSTEPMEFLTTVDNFYSLGNGDMLFLDYPVENFLEKENISSLEEYDINADEEQNDIILKKVGDKWKIHEIFIKTYIQGAKDSGVGEL